MLCRDAVDVEEADLFCLEVGNGGALGERIKVEVTQSLATAALGAGLYQRRLWNVAIPTDAEVEANVDRIPALA